MRTTRLFSFALLLAVPVVAQIPSVLDGGVVNAASFAKGQVVTPGSLVSIFGSELAAALAQADTVPLSTTLSNVSVTFNGVPAALDFVSPNQINAQVPWDVLSGGATAGTADLIVTRGSDKSTVKTIQIGPAAPGLFSVPPGVGVAIAINADGSLAAPANAISGIPTHPAKVGDVLILLGTGLGAVDSSVANGADSLDKLRHTVVTPGVLIGGQTAVVQFSGLSPQFPGVNQINVVVPNVPAGDALPIQLDMGGIRSTDKVTIAVTQ